MSILERERNAEIGVIRDAQSFFNEALPEVSTMYIAVIEGTNKPISIKPRTAPLSGVLLPIMAAENQNIHVRMKTVT
jgi:hypothetical protein